MSNTHLLRPKSTGAGPLLHQVTPATAGWKFLEFNMLSLQAGEEFSYDTEGKEVAVVPLSGEFSISVGGDSFTLKRKSVFAEMPQILYVPPGNKIQVKATAACEFTVGGAPAEGKYPLRLFQPSEMKQEVRGELPAQRQVNHVLSHPLPAERLILFEVYIPGGAWSGWPPHCHDGFDSSPYLEETYFYRFDPEPSGFGFHRNYRTDEDFNEVFSIQHNDLVMVTKGFHPTVAAPGSKMFFLNYLAGDLLDEQRATPPTDDKDWTFMKQDQWAHNRFGFPAFDSDGKTTVE